MATQIVKHKGRWHVLDVDAMRTTCCAERINRVRAIASALPTDEPRCPKLAKAAH